MLYKPQVTSVLFLGVALFAVINPVARWRMLKGFLIATLALSIPAFILIPAWPFDWLKILGWLSNNDETTHIEYVAALGWFGYIVVGLVVVLNIWVWWRAARVSENDPDRTFYLGLALSVGVMSSLFLLPRTGSYDHIANFLPLTFCWSYIALRWKGTARKITIGLGWLVLFVSSITYLFVQGNEIFAVTLALSAFYLGWVAYDFFRKPAPAAGN
jgi:glycopeptide antibiotics resistance protein